MSLAHLTAPDGLWIALSVFFVVVALALVYLLARLRSAAEELGTLMRATRDEAVPVLRKVEATVERVNEQLDKLDRIAHPAQKLSAFAAGIAQSGGTFRGRRGSRDADEEARR